MEEINELFVPENKMNLALSDANILPTVNISKVMQHLHVYLIFIKWSLCDVFKWRHLDYHMNAMSFNSVQKDIIFAVILSHVGQLHTWIKLQITKKSVIAMIKRI